MRIVWLCCLCCSTIPIFTQAQSLAGIVTDQHGKPIPYANVGLVADKRGTVSDSLGRFHLNLTAAADSLRITSLGYRPFQQAVATLANPVTVQLAEQPVQFREVAIRSRAPKARRVGNKGKAGATVHFVGSSLGAEISTRIPITRPSDVQTLHIYLSDNPQALTARVHFYPVVNGLPGDQPLHPPLLVALPSSRQRVDVDVRHLNLILDQDIFLGLEIVQATNVTLLSKIALEGGLFSGPTFIRETHLSAWEPMEDLVFNYGVGFELTVLQ